MTSQRVTFHLAEHLYGVDVHDVQEVLPARTVTPVPQAPPDLAGLVNLRGQVVMAVDLRARLGLGPHEGQQMLVVVMSGPDPVALLVDRIGDVVEVRSDQFEPAPPTLPTAMSSLLHGAYKLDGRLLLALDVHAATA